LSLYTLLSLLLTWPLVTRFATHVTGDGIDDPALAWNLWWIKTRLVDQVSFDIFHSGWMFHPIDINLAFYTLTPINGLLSTPLQSALNLIVANNLLLLSSFILGGYGVYLLATDLLAHFISAPSTDGQAHSRRSLHLAALVAGVVYAFASSKFFYASLGQFNIASSQWIPFTVLYVLRTGRASSRSAGMRYAALAGIFLVFQAWAELTYASFLLIFIALYFLWRIVVIGPPATSVSRLSDIVDQLGRFLLMGVFFLAGIVPFLLAMAPDMLRDGDFFASGGGFADIFSADLMGYLLPTRLHPLLGSLVAGLPFPNDKGQQVFIGYTVLILALLGAYTLIRSQRGRTRRAAWFWIVATLTFWLLTLGPKVRWAGQDLPIPGPFMLVSQLPFFSGNRYPSRYSVMLMLCVAVLVAFGLFWLLTRRWAQERRWAPAVLTLVMAALILFEHLSIPLPLNDFRTPSIYEQVAALPGESTLLELPTGWRNGARVLGKSDVLIMMQQWYQSSHGKRRLGGNTSRNPAYKFQYFTEAPFIGDLIALMNADSQNPATRHIAVEVDSQMADMLARGRALAPGALDFLGVNYVLVHVDQSPAPLLRYVDEALPLALIEEWQGEDWQGRPATMRLYQVTEKGPAGWSVDMATAQGNLHLAEGWAALPTGPGSLRYALRPEVDLMLDLPVTGGQLTLDLASPAETVEFSVNDRAVGTVSIDGAEESSRFMLDIPPGVGDALVDRLTLHFVGEPVAANSRFAPPSADGWPVGATGVNLDADVSLVARSAGEEVGDFARIFVNGVDVAHNERGYNLVALTPAGELLDSVTFDTLVGVDESAAMATWLEQWQSPTIIAGAVADEASLNLTEEAVNALARIGVVGDLRNKFRWSHAFVTVAGANVETGSAIEAMSLLQPASVTVGAPIDGERVYGGVGLAQFAPHQ